MFNLHLRAANRLPEIDIQAVFEIGAALGMSLRACRQPAAAPKELTENIAEAAAPPPCRLQSQASAQPQAAVLASGCCCCWRRNSAKSNPSKFGPPGRA